MEEGGETGLDASQGAEKTGSCWETSKVQGDGPGSRCSTPEEGLSFGQARHEEEVQEHEFVGGKLVVRSSRGDGGFVSRKSEDAVGGQSWTRCFSLPCHPPDADPDVARARHESSEGTMVGPVGLQFYRQILRAKMTQ